MHTKTNFSFELYYAESSASTQAQRDHTIRTLETSLGTLFAASDSTASITASDSHKGSSNKIIELVTTLQDVQIAQILKDFCEANGTTITVLE